MESLAEELHTLALRAELQQTLLGEHRKFDSRSDRVGIALVEPVDLGVGTRNAPDKVGEGLACCLGRFGILWLCVLVRGDRLDLSGRVVVTVEALEDPEGLLAGDDDVEAPVVEPFEHFGDPGGAADPPGAAVVVAQDDAKRLLGLQAVTDHALVALLEDVERHQLSGQEDDRKLEQRQFAQGLVAHPRKCRRDGNRPQCPRMGIDWESEGLLEGIEGKAREGRLQLLDELHESGMGLEQLREAVNEGRLVLLPLEQALMGDGRQLTQEEVSEESGVELDFLRKQWRALGMPEPEDDSKTFTERDVESAKIVKQLTDIGIPGDEMLQVSRVIGMTMSQLAAANRGLGVRVFAEDGDSEYEIGKRFAAIAEGVGPLLGSILEYALQLHMREQIRHDAFASGEISSSVEAGIEVAVAFADLVGFTKLGERLDPAEIGDLSERLSDMASDVSGGPVRLVKLIGDAVMFTSNDPACLLDAALELVAKSEEGGDDFPLLRAGAAYGRAVARGGDYYGRPVNLASRITAMARPGSVVCDVALHNALEDRYDWSFAGGRSLKGIDGEQKLFRARPLADSR